MTIHKSACSGHVSRICPETRSKSLAAAHPRLYGGCFAPGSVMNLLSPERNYARFLEWAERAEGQSLVTALRVMTATGAKMVQGRSRGAGKRSSLRQEPQILGVIRGTGAASNHGGRPRNEGHQSLVMRLALAWFTATNESPKPGRSDKSGFGDLVHSVF